ncbi:MAG: hypothetical protein E6I91_09965 [Chloroflexi bacterium]|nr:MAG: hypothetical protein E6I91_09965 [Chloroflexota bacterium]
MSIAKRVARLACCIEVEVGKHDLRNGVPELQARLVIDPRVHSREDPAQTSLCRHIVVAGKGPNGTRQNVGGDPDLILVAEEGGEHGRCRRRWYCRRRTG